MSMRSCRTQVDILLWSHFYSSEFNLFLAGFQNTEFQWSLKTAQIKTKADP